MNPVHLLPYTENLSTKPLDGAEDIQHIETGDSLAPSTTLWATDSKTLQA